MFSVFVKQSLENSNLDWARRYEHEAKIMLRLRNILGIPSLHSALSKYEGYLLIMDWVDAKPISELLTPNSFIPLKKIIKIGIKMCKILSIIHARGVIHRDLDDANVMIDNYGEIWITDFGISGIIGEDLPDDLLRSGTAGFVPLERSQQKQPTTLEDIYAIGAVLFTLATGDYADRDDVSTWFLETSWRLRKLKNHPEMIHGFESIIWQSVRNTASSRYQTAKEMQYALEQVLETL